MKKTFLFIAAALMSTMMWAETATSTFTDKNWTVGEGEEAWVAAGAATNSFDSQNGRGVQITLKNIQADGLTLTNSTIQDLGDISKVEVVYSSNCEGSEDGTIAVTVGATAFGEAFTIKKENNATISFENETAVAGDIVITFTSTATSKSVYVKSITVTYGGSTPERTLQSIYIAGEATELEYFVGETFDPAGLKVMGVYDSGDDTEITSGFDWSYDPEVFALGDESVDVTATYKDFTSEVFTVNDIVVTEKPAPVGVAYTKVTDVATLANGDVIVLVSGEDAYGVAPDGKTFINAKAIDGVEATLVEGVLTAGDAYELTLSKSDDNWTMVGADGTVGTKAAKAFTFGKEDVTNTWSISISEGNAIIASTNSDYGTIQYNASNPRFVNYASTQKAIQIYKKSSVGPGTGIREAMVNANVRKAMVNGRLIIVKGEKAFDLQGRIVK